MLRELLLACAFLTRLPLRPQGGLQAADLAACVHLFPLVGALVGAAGGLAFAAASLAGLPSLASAILAMAAMALLTGALHEDGLAASADALAAPHQRAGGAGTVAIVLVLTARLIALSSFWEPLPLALLLIAGGAFSRALMPFVLPVGEAAAIRPANGRLALALAGGALFPLVLLPTGPALGAMAAASLAALAAGPALRRRVGGGDAMGAVQQLAEAAFLLLLVAHR